MRSYWLCLLLLCITTLHAEEITILPLHHQLPEQVLPTLEPLVSDGGSIVGAGNQLFVRTTPENLIELQKVLAAIDQPMRRLLISVRQGNDSRAQTRERLLHQGRIQLGQQPHVEMNGVIQDGQQTGNTQTTQQVQTVEGSAARIYLGQSLPVPMHQMVMGKHQAILTESIQYVDIGTGFTAQPRLSGNQVILSITPSQQQLSGNQIEQASLSTTISGPIGEWISLGGGDVTSQHQLNGLAGSSQQQTSRQQQVWLKVDLLN
jgi:hypothetical protein